MSRADAERFLQRCLDEGEIIPSKHFRDELANERLEWADALGVLSRGRIYNEPEPDIKTGEWKYAVEGHEPEGKWIAVVFCFKSVKRVLLITVFSVSSRSQR